MAALVSEAVGLRAGKHRNNTEMSKDTDLRDLSGSLDGCDEDMMGSRVIQHDFLEASH